MKNILIDCRFSGAKAGLGSYTREIASSLLKLPDSSVQFMLLVRSKNEEWIPAGASLIEADIPHYSLAEQTTLPGVIKETGADLLFSPHFNVPLRCPIPFVVTIHDLILHRFPNNASFIKQTAYRLLIKNAISKSSTIISISNFVKEEIIHTYGQPLSEKIHVVHEGVDPLFQPETKNVIENLRTTYNLQKPFFLYVGNAKQHKHVRVLVDAYVVSGRTDAELILITGGPEASRLEPLPPGVRFVRNVPASDLSAFYSAAEALLTASHYEGFCLPVVEALACGCPVIASNKTVIPEVASGRATLIDPTVENFSQALHSPTTRPTPFVFGRWDEAARNTLDILRSVIF